MGSSLGLQVLSSCIIVYFAVSFCSCQYFAISFLAARIFFLVFLPHTDPGDRLKRTNWNCHFLKGIWRCAPLQQANTAKCSGNVELLFCVYICPWVCSQNHWSWNGWLLFVLLELSRLSHSRGECSSIVEYRNTKLPLKGGACAAFTRSGRQREGVELTLLLTHSHTDTLYTLISILTSWPSS